MPKITIDEKEYDSEEMSEEARRQVQALQFVEGELLQLQLRSAAMQTARNGYAMALKSLLESGENTDDDSASVSIPDNLSFD